MVTLMLFNKDKHLLQLSSFCFIVNQGAVTALPLDTKISHYLASQLHFSIQNSGELEQIFVQKVKLTSEIDQF